MSGSTMFLIVVTVFFLVSFFFLPPFLPLPSLLHCGAVQILRGEGKEIELVDVSIATRSHEFYGKWDDEGKWQDSPFTAALRKFQSEGEKAGGLQVVYIKGDVTLFIAEDLKNQVASKDELLIPDDTKLTVPTSVRLIVEVGEHAPNEVPSKCANVVLPNEEEEDE
mmetsp:Transcript_49844/g.128247  ORF Transcript_49844/g.128247 Transcript_49844/m.128247 type:complete len:166 (+) Transcript_49844:958-1455(+)